LDGSLADRTSKSSAVRPIQPGGGGGGGGSNDDLPKKKDGRGRPRKDRGPDYVTPKDILTPDCTRQQQPQLVQLPMSQATEATQAQHTHHHSTVS